MGFKNGTDGNVGIAIDAIRAASASHHFLSVTKQGLSAIVQTTGNPDCHIILRGGATGPNYSKEHLTGYIAQLEKAGVCPKLMIDCSHGKRKVTAPGIFLSLDFLYLDRQQPKETCAADCRRKLYQRSVAERVLYKKLHHGGDGREPHQGGPPRSQG